MHRAVVASVAAAMGVSAVLAGNAVAGGNGAQLSGLSLQSGSNGNQCQPGTGSGTNGFVMFNAPGAPGAARKLLGEVSLKRGPANTAFSVYVGSGNSCTPAGMLTTNGQGNGNAHIANSKLNSGTFYVVLDNGANEAYASGPVTVN